MNWYFERNITYYITYIYNEIFQFLVSLSVLHVYKGHFTHIIRQSSLNKLKKTLNVVTVSKLIIKYAWHCNMKITLKIIRCIWKRMKCFNYFIIIIIIIFNLVVLQCPSVLLKLDVLNPLPLLKHRMQKKPHFSFHFDVWWSSQLHV